jgi:hypothetical protein
MAQQIAGQQPTLFVSKKVWRGWNAPNPVCAFRALGCLSLQAGLFLFKPRSSSPCTRGKD